ncbi:hypothetical protein [Arthrobacter sp. JCM 19049]|uniref:hypothetical protein n=1 Tax=Arthrobacter sp. JCM 19049 TaxID=1460643 RepID=UPI00243684A5|nr:hypothetical protein [Arthrobacter sp. JCM 19049]
MSCPSLREALHPGHGRQQIASYRQVLALASRLGSASGRARALGAHPKSLPGAI